MSTIASPCTYAQSMAHFADLRQVFNDVYDAYTEASHPITNEEILTLVREVFSPYHISAAPLGGDKHSVTFYINSVDDGRTNRCWFNLCTSRTGLSVTFPNAESSPHDIHGNDKYFTEYFSLREVLGAYKVVRALRSL